MKDGNIISPSNWFIFREALQFDYPQCKQARKQWKTGQETGKLVNWETGKEP
jgi:hypothetical protein